LQQVREFYYWNWLGTLSDKLAGYIGTLSDKLAGCIKTEAVVVTIKFRDRIADCKMFEDSILHGCHCWQAVTYTELAEKYAINKRSRPSSGWCYVYSKFFKLL